jgi:hypothetical protein
MHEPFGKAKANDATQLIKLPHGAMIEERWRMSPVRRPSPLYLRHYKYVDEARIDSYLAQLDAVLRRRKRKKELSLGLAGLKALWSSEEGESPLPLEDRIDHLLRVLTKKGMVTGQRPDKFPRNCTDIAPLVHEVCDARQFVFSGDIFRPELGISALKLWVSEPDRADFRDEMFEWTGSYLFLTEVRFDNLRYSYFISGCSALRFIFDVISRNAVDHAGEEVLGRWDQRPMADKLLSIGAIPLANAKIECLYSIRYITDEQFHPAAPQDGRVHDILGYPVFIAGI